MTSSDENFIPLIDLAPWFDGDDSARAELAATVDAQLQRCGFLVVVNHGIDPLVLAEARAACTDFFHQPEAEKAKLTPINDAYRGWIGGGKESNAATYGVDTPPDLKETFAYGTVDVRDESLRAEHPTWYAPNQWPSAPQNSSGVKLCDSLMSCSSCLRSHWASSKTTCSTTVATPQRPER
jgi:isopenicillin N synthase-like dioxygenase